MICPIQYKCQPWTYRGLKKCSLLTLHLGDCADIPQDLLKSISMKQPITEKQINISTFSIYNI